MVSPGMIAGALLDCLAICIDGLGIFAAAGKSESEAIVRVGVVGLLFNRGAERIDCCPDVAGIQKRARKLIMGAGKATLAHLNRHSVTIDCLVKPTLVVEDETLVEVLLCGA